MRTWARAIRVGKVGEAALARLLAAAGVTLEKNPDKKPPRSEWWDLRGVLPWRGPTTFEVKRDEWEADSGNVAVEYFNSKLQKPSGLLATRADLWVFSLRAPERVFAGRVDRLKEYFRREKPVRNVEKGGDDNSSMLLFRGADILPAIFTRLDDLRPDDMLAALRRMLP